MKLTKVHWFYEIEIDGKIVGSVQKENNGQWKAHGNNDNWLYFAKTRKQAIENMLNQNRK